MCVCVCACVCACVQPVVSRDNSVTSVDRPVREPTSPIKHLDELKDFTIAPLTDLWKTRELEAKQLAQALAIKREKANVLRWTPAKAAPPPSGPAVDASSEIPSAQEA